MEPVTLTWIAFESRSALLASMECEAIATELLTADPRSWGFFKLSGDNILVVGYADLGLLPIAAQWNGSLFVGIDEILVGFDMENFCKKFSYRMPSVFHEFLSFENQLIVRDEIGFVGISHEGKELWCCLTSGPVKSFSIEGRQIRGETIDGDIFDIYMPS